MSLFRVALIGCGLISEEHVRAYGKFADRARIAACFDADPERAAQRAAPIGARVASSLQEVLEDPEIDAVEILTPHHLHADAVVAAAEAGKHILCQKPLARTLPECDAMIAAARQARVTLFYGEMMRTLPSVRAARAAVEEGRIGRLVGVRGSYAHWQGGAILGTAWRYDPNVAGGGQLLDGGIHYLAAMQAIAGAVRCVSCFTTRFRPELGGEDTASLILRFEEGHLGTLFSSHASGIWSPGPNTVIYGTEGALALGGPLGALALHRNDLPDRHEVLLASDGNAFEAMIGRYLDTVLDGAPSVSPPEAGREDLRLVLAAYRSAERGEEVRVDEVEAA